MKKKKGSASIVLITLSFNLFITAVKLLATLATRSSAMFSETLHSAADSLQQIFLFTGIKAGDRKADELHPFGFSAESYFWSFIIAIFMFTAGSVTAIIRGIVRLHFPQPLQHPNVAFGVLILAIATVALCFRRTVRNIGNERGKETIFSYLRRTRKSDLTVVLIEDIAAIIGLAIALVFLIAQKLSGFLLLDGVASILIGILLAVIALVLGFEIRSLRIGESADPELLKTIYAIIRREENLRRVIHIRSLQVDPDDIVLAVKAEFDDRLNAVEIGALIHRIEEEIRDQHPNVRKIFIDPAVYRSV